MYVLKREWDMPHTKSAKKRHRQSLLRRAQNRTVRADLRTEVKKLLKSIKDGKLEEAKAGLNVVYKKLDKCAARRYIHPNAACRHKSRLTARVNALAMGKTA